MFFTINQAAKATGFRPSTIKRKIKQGLIRGYRMGGSCSPQRINEDELHRAMTGLVQSRQSAAGYDEWAAGQPRTTSEEWQYAELVRRMTKLRETLGSLNAVRPLLDALGAKQLDDLHPRHYPRFRAQLMRLTRGLTNQHRSQEKAA